MDIHEVSFKREERCNCQSWRLWVNVVYVSLDGPWKTWKWSDTRGDTAACWAAMSLCQCQQRTREKGKRQSICSPFSHPSFLSLSGFYLANGGLHADWCGVSLKPKRRCAIVCVRMGVCVYKLILILQSLVIIPQQSLTMPFGHFPFCILRSTSLFLMHSQASAESDFCESSTATYRVAVLQTDIHSLIKPAHQTAPDPCGPCPCFIKICEVNVIWIPGAV